MSMIWMTDAVDRLQTSRPLGSMTPGSTEAMPLNEAVALIDRVKWLQPIEDAEIPRRFIRTVKLKGVQDRRGDATFPAITHAGFIFVNSRARGCLDRLDLGRTSILPVEIHDSEGTTLLRDDISLLLVRENRRTFDLDQSTAVKRVYPSSRRFTFDTTQIPNTGNVRLLPGACEGSDLWVDPMIGSRLFLSAKAAELFRASGILMDLKPKPIHDGQDNHGPWD